MEDAPPSPRAQLVDDFALLLRSDLFSDVAFIVEGQRIPGHKCVLAARSPFFRDLFVEQSGTEIKIEGVRGQIFNAILQYLYTARLDLDPQLALELVVSADRFRLNDMKSHCFGKIEQTFDETNVCEIMALADQHSADSLKAACLRYIIDHYTVVTRTDGFRRLNKDLILEVVRSR
eukprot:TRINITY_DN14785_c0_g1_i1.p1 TRINITY_DN14785_c0_g1~~TRINITY_DN14785_c0_g1_i1.p1  ORF type:complete len:189 (+),score=23.07 TRINITY_DN14785_c0_g1_i1:42-569(+)